MNSLLLKHKPADLEQEKFIDFWENSGYTLTPLAKAILELMPKEKIVPEDFSNPNHYAQMVWAQAQRDFGQKILDLMPKTIDTE